MEGKGNRSCFQHDYKLIFLLNAVMLQNALMRGDFQKITSFWCCLEKTGWSDHHSVGLCQHSRRVWVRQSRTSCVLLRIIYLWGWCPSFGQLDSTGAKPSVFISLSYWFLPSFIIFLPPKYTRLVPLDISSTCLWCSIHAQWRRHKDKLLFQRPVEPFHHQISICCSDAGTSPNSLPHMLINFFVVVFFWWN